LKLYTAIGHKNYQSTADFEMQDIIIKCGIRDGETVVEKEIEEGGCEDTFLRLSLT
jgi:hypothetical protein